MAPNNTGNEDDGLHDKSWFQSLSPENQANARADFLRNSRPQTIDVRSLSQEESESGQPNNDLVTPVARGTVSSATRDDLFSSYLRPNGPGTSAAGVLAGAVTALVTEHVTDSASGASEGGCLHKSQLPAPVLCLLQSTGYGKTRAVVELAKAKPKQVVYLFWKSLTGSWEVPLVLKDILGIGSLAELAWETKWERFLSAISKTVEEIGKDTTTTLYDEQFNENRLGNFYDRLKVCYDSMKSPKRSSIRKDGQQQNSKKVVFDYSNAAPVTAESVIVCFDEASALPLDAIRALRHVSKAKGIIIILADTAASICKFMPPNDHSTSLHGGNLGRFIAPIFSFENFDLVWSFENKDDDYEALFCCGRQRWQSHIREMEKGGTQDEERIKSLLALARRLLTTEPNTETIENETLSCNDPNISSIKPQMIALFACRFALGESSKLSEMLVKYSLVTVSGLSEDRSVIECEYPSEPVLAEASARYTSESPQNKNLFEVLWHVQAALHSHGKLLEPPRGDAGEMCAAALFGYSMDFIRKDLSHKYMSQAVPLKDFLDMFDYGCALPDCLDGWQVNFTHFIRPDCIPDEDELPMMWKRRVAYYVPKICEGLDLLIIIHKEAEYATLRVQVKNKKQEICASDRNTYLQLLLPSQCPPKTRSEPFSVGLLINTNKIKKDCRLVDGSGTRIRRRTTRDSNRPNMDQQVLQLAASFPSKREHPLSKVADTLRSICSINTYREIERHSHGNDGIRRETMRLQAHKRETSAQK